MNNTLKCLENYWWVVGRSATRIVMGRIYLDSTQERNDTGRMERHLANLRRDTHLPLQAQFDIHDLERPWQPRGNRSHD